MILVGLLAWLLMCDIGLAATPPTLSAYQQSTWSDQTGTTEATAALTWSAGDLVLVLGFTEDNDVTLATPTATGLTFGALSGFPTATASHVKLYAWSATAGAGGTQAISSTTDGSGSMRGLAAFAFTGSDGIGTIAVQVANGSTTTQSLTRGFDNSAVVQVMGDWSATTDVTVSWTPAGFTQRVAQNNVGRATAFVASWTDQGSAGTTSYGFSAGAGTNYSAATVEIKGTASGGAAETFGFYKRRPQ